MNGSEGNWIVVLLEGSLLSMSSLICLIIHRNIMCTVQFRFIFPHDVRMMVLVLMFIMRSFTLHFFLYFTLV